MKRILLMFFVLVLAYGCVPQEPADDGQQRQGPADGGQPGTGEGQQALESCDDGVQNQGEEGVDCGGPCEACEQEQEDYHLSAQQLSALQDKVTKGTRSSFLVKAYPSGLEVGESYVFAHGFTHMDLEAQEGRFRYVIEFESARDSKNNRISADAQTVLGWFSGNEFPEVSLQRYEQSFVPVGVTVGEHMANGSETAAGTYYFRLIVEIDRGHRYEEYAADSFSFRVV